MRREGSPRSLSSLLRRFRRRPRWAVRREDSFRRPTPRGRRPHPSYDFLVGFSSPQQLDFLLMHGRYPSAVLQVRRWESARDFLDRARAHLLAREAENNVVFGIANDVEAARYGD